MPIIGLRKHDGTDVPFEDVDTAEWTDYGVSPATLVYLVNQNSRRENVGILTASQWGKGLRQLWLEHTVDVFVAATDSMGALMGTAKHSHILTEGYDKGDIKTEVRLRDTETSISGQADQIFHGKAVVTIWDQKTGKKYSLKKFREDTFNHDYTHQLNLLADLWEQENPEWPAGALWIEWIPSDAGRGDPGVEQVPVPRWEPGRALELYRERAGELAWYLDEDEVPPVCSPEERWERTAWKTKTVEQVKCLDYCPYRDACVEIERTAGRVHPLDRTNT